MRRKFSLAITNSVIFIYVFVAFAGLLRAPAQQQPTREQSASDSSSIYKGARSGIVRPVTIPVTYKRTRGTKAEQEMYYSPGNLMVREDGDEQRILSIRSIGNAPVSIAIIIQDGVVPSISNDIKSIADFIRRLPRGSRVMVGYIRSGSLEVRQRFTADLERATNSLRIPINSASVAPLSPYIQVIEALKRFESLPTGRRALLLISDGLDTRSGLDSSSPALSIDLDRAITEAQRRSVAVYSFYAPTIMVSALNSSILTANAQGSLARLSDETGGRAFFQGTGAPVSFDPFLRELYSSLNSQIAITYLSTHPEKGFHRIKVTTDARDIKIEHPAGYTR
jgi:VWFA-related protein